LFENYPPRANRPSPAKNEDSFRFNADSFNNKFEESKIFVMLLFAFGLAPELLLAL